MLKGIGKEYAKRHTGEKEHQAQVPPAAQQQYDPDKDKRNFQQGSHDR
jgi:hypothetical protein